MNAIERQILEGIARDAKAIGASRPYQPDLSCRERGLAVLLKQDLGTLGVRLDHGRWLGLGSLDAAGRQAARRAAMKLEKAGLLVLAAAWGNRITHARLTPAGETLARAILGADQGPVEGTL